MVQITSDQDDYPTVIALSRGEVFYAEYLAPNDASRYAQIDYVAGDVIRLIMKKNCIVVVRDLKNPFMRAELVLFMREDRSSEGVYGLWFAKPYEVPNLREALRNMDVPQIHSVTGMNDVVIYNDEVMITDYERRGPYGWIIKREDVSRYIAVLPEIRDSGKTDRLSIWVEMHEREDGGKYSMIRVEGWSRCPVPERDNHTLRSRNEYLIVFDIGSRVIKTITLTNTSVEAIPCDKGPLRGIKVGNRLPENLARNKWLP